MTSLVESLQVLAAAEVLRDQPGSKERPSGAYELRKVFSAYSEAFHTPLHLVYELPLDFVLTAYYERAFRELAADPSPDAEAEWHELLDRLSDTPEERAQREKVEAADRAKGDEFFEQANRQAKEAEEKVRAARDQKGAKRQPVRDALDSVRAAVEEVRRVQRELGADEVRMRFEKAPEPE